MITQDTPLEKRKYRDKKESVKKKKLYLDQK